MSLAASEPSLDSRTASPKQRTTGSEGTVVTLKLQRRRFDPARLRASLQGVATAVVPPTLVIAILLVVWQVAFSAPGAGLPTPIQVWTDAKDLILDPFFVYGSQDIGLGLRVLTSLQRVAVGFGLAAIAVCRPLPFLREEPPRLGDVAGELLGGAGDETPGR